MLAMKLCCCLVFFLKAKKRVWWRAVAASQPVVSCGEHSVWAAEAGSALPPAPGSTRREAAACVCVWEQRAGSICSHREQRRCVVAVRALYACLCVSSCSWALPPVSGPRSRLPQGPGQRRHAASCRKANTLTHTQTRTWRRECEGRKKKCLCAS